MSGPKRARRARALLATLLFCGIPGTAQAHPIHSTLTEIMRGNDGTVTVRIRTFADDFSAAVARYVRGVQRRDYVVADADAGRYLGATLVLTDRRGVTIPVAFVSQQRTGDVVWLELRAPSTTLAGASVRNAMLFEVHEDQVNIVKASYDRTSFTTLFSSGDRAKKLP
jgi:hypothetical protein